MQLGLNDNSILIDNVENCDTDGGEDGLTNVAVISDQSPKFYIDTPYVSDIPKEIEVTTCIPPEYIMTQEEIDFENEKLEKFQRDSFNDWINFSKKDFYNRENIIIEDTDDPVTKFTKKHALAWEFSTQKKRIYDDHIFQIKKREDYIRKHRLILENYEIAEKKILPVNYEDIDVDVSVNDLQLDKSETDSLAIEPSSDCIEDYPDYMEYIEESPYVPYEVY
jgi:hypothetical protein